MMWTKKTPKFKVTTDIRNMLLADSDIAALIGEKAFPVIAPEDTTGMYIIYQRDQYSVERTKMGTVLDVCRVYIDIIGDNYESTQDLAEKVYKVLDGDHPNGLRIYLADSTEDVVGDGINKKYIQVLLFEISNH